MSNAQRQPLQEQCSHTLAASQLKLTLLHHQRRAGQQFSSDTHGTSTTQGVCWTQKNESRTLLLTLVMTPRSAPWSSSAAATSRWPSRAARCRGVYPELVVESGQAPFPSSCWTMSCLPRRLEMCRGVWSSCGDRVSLLSQLHTTVKSIFLRFQTHRGVYSYLKRFL